nr:ATP-binding protein [uncultured Kingella sp.]
MTRIKHSLQLQLSLTITILLLVIALISGSLSFYETYHQTHKIQDDLLRQIAAYINPDQPLPKSQKSKNDARIHIRTSTQQAPDKKALPEASHLPDGFHTLTEADGDDTYRIYIQTTEQGKIIIYQENEYRDDLAQSIAWHSTTPILATIPLAIALLIWQIRRALRPLRQQSQELQQRQATNLAPLNPQQAPSEIQGFIHAINQLLNRTHQAMQQQQRFIADAAHELRTPTTALSLQAERLSEHNLPPELKEQIGSLKTTIHRSHQLQEQLLTLARSQTNSEQAQTPSTPIQPIFQRIIQDLHPLAQAKNQDIGVTSSENPILPISEIDLYTLIKTLADNAIRYTPAGSQIDLSSQSQQNSTTIIIEDNGNGIPPSERQRIFDPFYRILGSGEQGTGLGLSIAQTIAQRHGGSITLHDSQTFPTGLRVEINLPNGS